MATQLWFASAGAPVPGRLNRQRQQHMKKPEVCKRFLAGAGITGMRTHVEMTPDVNGEGKLKSHFKYQNKTDCSQLASQSCTISLQLVSLCGTWGSRVYGCNTISYCTAYMKFSTSRHR